MVSHDRERNEDDDEYGYETVPPIPQSMTGRGLLVPPSAVVGFITQTHNRELYREIRRATMADTIMTLMKTNATLTNVS